MSGTTKLSNWKDDGTNLSQKIENKPLELGSGNVTTTGQVSATTLTDGTASLSAGDLTDLSSLSVIDESAIADNIFTIEAGSEATPSAYSVAEIRAYPNVTNEVTLRLELNSQGIPDSGAYTNFDSHIVTSAADVAGTVIIGYSSSLDDTLGINGTHIAFASGPNENNAFDADFATIGSNLVISAFDSMVSNGGYGVTINTASATGGDVDGGSITNNLGSPNGEGDVGEFKIIQANPDGDDGVAIVATYDKTAAADDRIMDFRIQDGDDNTWGRWNSFALDTTADHQFGAMTWSMMVNGDEKTDVFAIDGELDEGDITFNYMLAAGGTIYLAPDQGEDADAPGLFLIYGADGGESTTGNGYKGQVMQVTGGWGSDGYETGITNGGDGNNLYLAGGTGGEGKNGGTNGAVGNTILGYDYKEEGAVGMVLVGTATADGTGATLQVTGTESQGGLIRAASSESVADDGTIVLETGVAGMLSVWTEAEYMQVYVATDGTVSSIVGSTNTAIADTDGDLCVYDGGTGAIIKNRLDATKTVRYLFRYS